MYWAATAGFVGGMACPAAASARGMTAHGKYMSKKRAEVCNFFYFLVIIHSLTSVLPLHSQAAVAQAVLDAEEAAKKVRFISRRSFDTLS
jgi:hypothetical protein